MTFAKLLAVNIMLMFAIELAIELVGRESTIFAYGIEKEPVLQELTINNCRAGEIASIDLVNSFKDMGNEYWITWYVDGVENETVWGLYGNQLILVSIDESLAGKKLQLKIKPVNGDCEAWTAEQEVLPSNKE